jgi:hypothetical protein
MAGDDKKAKADPVQKSEGPGKSKGASHGEPSKGESGEPVSDVPSGYSRGEGQKPVSKAYRDNWSVIFGKKKKR